MNQDETEAFNAALRTDLHFFTQRAFEEVNPGQKFMDCWYFEAICHALMQAAEGKTQRLAIALPPRYGKSLTTSVAFPAWLLGNDPTRRILCASYSQPLATELSRKTRNIMQSKFYRRAFPSTALSAEKAAEDEFETTRHGSRHAVSVSGTVLGRGGDILIGDDLMHPNDVRSPEALQKVIEWYQHVFVTRLDDPRRGAIIVIGQRLHEDDLMGRLEREGRWQILKIPAIAETDRTYDLGGGRTFPRCAGDILHPMRMNRTKLEQTKSEMGERAFSAQFQQNPIPPEGALFRLHEFPRFSLPQEMTKGFAFVIQSWDVASSQRHDAAFSVCTTWGVRDATDFYLIDVSRDRLDPVNLNRRAEALYAKYDPDIVLVECNGVGIGLHSHLNSKIGRRVNRTDAKVDKVSRAEGLSSLIVAGRVHLPNDADWFDTFWGELSCFPQSRYSDQVDSFTQFLLHRNTLLKHAIAIGPRRDEGKAVRLPRPGGKVRVHVFDGPPAPRWCGLV